MLKNEHTIVSSLISKEQAEEAQVEELVDKTFRGDLPAFIAAFSRSRKLTKQEVEQLKALIDNYQEG